MAMTFFEDYDTYATPRLRGLVARWQHIHESVTERSPAYEDRIRCISTTTDGKIILIDFIENKTVGFGENVTTLTRQNQKSAVHRGSYQGSDKQRPRRFFV